MTSGDEVANVTCRYLQYRTLFDVPKDWMRITLNNVSINYHVPLDKAEVLVNGGTPSDIDLTALGWSVNLTLPDGDHNITIRLTDVTGTKVELSLDVKVDLYPPTGNITLEEGRWAHNSTALLIEVEANDTHTPLRMQLSRRREPHGARGSPARHGSSWGAPRGTSQYT